MGYKRSTSPEDLAQVSQIINSLAYYASDVRATGYVAWGSKQDLYRLKWILDSALDGCPNFGEVEQEWLREQEKQQVIRILKNEM